MAEEEKSAENAVDGYARQLFGGAGGKKASKDEAIMVVVRIRPPNSKEKQENAKISTVANQKENTVVCAKEDGANKTFAFDVTFGPETSQPSVYEYVARPVIEGCLSGYNGTIFAYGQTGAGKTFTMMGSKDNPGITPCAFTQIYRTVSNPPEGAQFLVHVSYLEIYNERVLDLLAKEDNKELKIRKDPQRGFFAEGLTSKNVENDVEMNNIMESGNKKRRVGATAMNQDSSRSHAMFTVVVEQIQDNAKIVAGKLNLVDLAGSERINKTGATGDRAKEGMAINKSLLILGNVISALVKKGAHVPYRESALTSLLSDSLGGNSRTVMIANCGPADSNLSETISTLNFADRVKQVKNKPRINEDPKDAKLREYKDEIERLKAQLAEGGPAASSATPTVDPTQSAAVKVQNALTTVLNQAKIKDLKDKLRVAGEQVSQLQEQVTFQEEKLAELESAKATRDELQTQLSQMASQSGAISMRLKQSEVLFKEVTSERDQAREEAVEARRQAGDEKSRADELEAQAEELQQKLLAAAASREVTTEAAQQADAPPPAPTDGSSEAAPAATPAPPVSGGVTNLVYKWKSTVAATKLANAEKALREEQETSRKLQQQLNDMRRECEQEKIVRAQVESELESNKATLNSALEKGKAATALEQERDTLHTEVNRLRSDYRLMEEEAAAARTNERKMRHEFLQHSADQSMVQYDSKIALRKVTIQAHAFANQLRKVWRADGTLAVHMSHFEGARRLIGVLNRLAYRHLRHALKKWINHSKSGGACFPEQLGPFGILPTSLMPKVNVTSDTYEVDLAASIPSMLEAAEGREIVLNVGQISPMHTITLSAQDRKWAHIPIEAKSFVWAYPLAGVVDLPSTEKLDFTSHSVIFALFGGYIYLDHQHKVLQANAIGQGNDLSFEPPRRWNAKFTDQLYKEGRFQELTIKPLLEAGAVRYCWLRPGETLISDEDGDVWDSPEHGAFVYLFSDDIKDSSEQDCFFAIKGSENSHGIYPFTFAAIPPALLPVVGQASDESHHHHRNSLETMLLHNMSPTDRAHQGWMMKQGLLNKHSWKRRYFVLPNVKFGKFLNFYKDEQPDSHDLSHAPRYIPLDEATLVDPKSGVSRGDISRALCVRTKTGHMYPLICSTELEAREWKEKIQQVIDTPSISTEKQAHILDGVDPVELEKLGEALEEHDLHQFQDNLVFFGIFNITDLLNPSLITDAELKSEVIGMSEHEVAKFHQMRRKLMASEARV